MPLVLDHDVLMDVGRTERSEFRQYTRKPELTLFGPADSTRSRNWRPTEHQPCFAADPRCVKFLFIEFTRARLNRDWLWL